jgi:AAA15 family ATPase/GTPase
LIVIPDIIAIFADIQQKQREYCMLLEFSVSNYRSVKEEQTLSMIAESSQAKPDNITSLELSSGSNLSVLKSAVIYGANASGKSNVVKAFQACISLVKRSATNIVGDAITLYDPFLFDRNTASAPTEFKLLFIGKDTVKYSYQFSYNKYEIVSETLDYYPKGQRANLFTRNNQEGETTRSHIITLSKNVMNQRIKKEVFKNQLYLSQFGSTIVHEQLTDVYLFFKDIDVWNTQNPVYTESMQEKLIDELLEPQNEELRKRLTKLIRVSDTKIENVRISKEIAPASLEKPVQTKIEYTLFGKHSFYDRDEKTGDRELPFREESAGSNILFTIGGFILKKLNNGGILFIDELDNSLHPKLTRFLIKLFNNPVSNPVNAQLVCATHEVTLLDKEMFRMDQVWFTEKNRFGATELYSIKDFDGVREGIPFDKWYYNGKFGGEPKIKEIAFIFGDE